MNFLQVKNIAIWSFKKKISKNENGENVPMEIIEVVLLDFEIVSNNYQQNSRVLYTFVSHLF